VNCIGSYKPEMVEIDPLLVKSARCLADDRRHVLDESGDFIQPIKRGEFQPDHILAEFADLAQYPEKISSIRRDANDISLYKSVGNPARPDRRSSSP